MVQAMRWPSCSLDARHCWPLALALIVVCQCCTSSQAVLPKELANQLQAIWDDSTLTDADVSDLRWEAWSMFNEGYTNYMSRAFPMDNLMPISCRGSNWQGGMALTLIDALDSLVMMGRLSDVRHVLPLLKQHVRFDRDIKIHVFEVVIRVVGGLLSGHSLLTSMTDTVPEYNNTLLEMATDLVERLAPAFESPSGLPFQFTNLKGGPALDSYTTCTACAGTLLLEYGTLSMLTGNPRWKEAAEKASDLLYEKRSALGLVGSSIDVNTAAWVSRDATTGPGIDSYYEYLLKAYLMFGNRTHLAQFADLYLGAMRHLQVPGTIRGYSFLADVHMESGRVSRPYISSLGAFWPGMQALIGQNEEAADLHANYTAAWQTWGWLPENFGLDLSRVNPEDPGYNLRPEHIESTYLLHAATGNPVYQKVAERIQRTLQTGNKAECGYASIKNVETGEKEDLQESFFLSETLKYLYLIFTPGAQHLLDYYILTTEGHLLPSFPAEDPVDEARHLSEALMEVLTSGGGMPPGCAKLCELIQDEEQSVIETNLRSAFPLLRFRREDALLIKRRRCAACLYVTKHMAANPPASLSTRTRIMQLSAGLQVTGGPPGDKALSQIVCGVMVSRAGQVSCSVLRPLMAHDMQHGLPHNSIILQLAWVDTQAVTDQQGLLIISPITPNDQTSLILPATTATFGHSLIEITPACLTHLLNTTEAWTQHRSRLTARPECRAKQPSSPAASPGSPAAAQITWSGLMQEYRSYSPALTLQQLAVPGLRLANQVLLAQQIRPRPSRLVPAGSNCSAAQPNATQPLVDAVAESGQVAEAAGSVERVVHAEVGWWPGEEEGLQEQQKLSLVTGGGGGGEAGHVVVGSAPDGFVQGMCVDPGCDVRHADVSQGNDSADTETQALDNGSESDSAAAGVPSDAVQQADTAAASSISSSTGPHDTSALGAGGASADAAVQLVQPVNGSGDSEVGLSEAGVDKTGHAAVAVGTCSMCQEGEAAVQEVEAGGGGGQQGSASGASDGSTAPQGSHTEQIVSQQPTATSDSGPLESAGGSQLPPAGSSASTAKQAVQQAAGQRSQSVHGRPRAGKKRRHGKQARAARGRCRLETPEITDPHQTGPCTHVPVAAGELVLADPLQACTLKLDNAGELEGAVVVVTRGGCSFALKAQAVQQAGGAAMIVLNLQNDDQLITMTGDAEVAGNALRIPSLLLTGRNSRLLLNAVHTALQAYAPRPVATLARDHAKLHSPHTWALRNRLQAADDASRAGKPRAGNTRIDMLIPTTSHAFIKAKMLSHGFNLQQSLESLMADERIMLLLMQVAKENEALAQQQQAQEHKYQQSQQQQQQQTPGS